jgi:hypothetical protein
MENDIDKAKTLARVCQDAFQLFPHDCSHAVWHVISQYNPNQPYMQANDLVSQLSRSVDWKEVQLSELSRLANQGALIIGGLQAAPYGHVIVVYPGAEKPKGGYFYIKKGTEEKRMSPQSGMYARAMSTSISKNPFPGTLSRGEKTVRDPWSAQDFKQVKFWQYVGALPVISHQQKEETKKVRDSSEKIWI